MGFLSLLPLIAAFLGFIICVFVFAGISLVILGITGIVMNKLHKKLTQSEQNSIKPIFNITSVILGILVFLFPIGFLLYGILSSLMQSGS